MGLGDWVTPFQGLAYRHIPADSPLDVLDLTFAVKARENRWSKEGEPTLYFAKDVDVAAAEWARHLKTNRNIDSSLDLARIFRPRAVYRCEIQNVQIIDLCDKAIWAELSLQNLPFCFIDIVRRTTPAQGLRVPSLAFLDDLDQWVLVLFREKLPKEDREFVTSKEHCGMLSYGTVSSLISSIDQDTSS
jgi:hypothetical protein